MGNWTRKGLGGRKEKRELLHADAKLREYSLSRGSNEREHE